MALSLIAASQREHTSFDALPAYRDEFNDDIFRYMSQLHQEQMRHRAQDSPRNHIPADVQQALNLNTAFLRFTDNLVGHLIAQQIACQDCKELHDRGIDRSSTLDEHARLLNVIQLLNTVVDAHVNHGDARDSDDYGYRLAKSALLVIEKKLQACRKAGSRMKEIADCLWITKRSISHDRFDSQDMLQVEWKKIKSSLKALYQHFLYFFKCLDVVESIREWQAVNTSEQQKAMSTIARVQREFIRYAAVLSNEQDNYVASTGPSIAGTNGTVVALQTDDMIAQAAQEACTNLLESLKSLTIGPVSSDVQDDSKQSSSSEEQSKPIDTKRQQAAFTELSQAWILHRDPELPSLDSWSLIDTRSVSQVGNEPASDGSGNNSSNKGERSQPSKAQQHGTQCTGESSRGGNFNKGFKGREKDNADRDDENDEERGKKRQRLDATAEELKGFACPYYKRDPQRQWKSQACPTSNYKTLHRLKEHIYRTHKRPIYCGRCRNRFPNSRAVEEHQQQAMSCELRTEPLYTGYTELMEEKLRSRKQGPKGPKGEAEKWREVYLILFPDDDPNQIPLHYHDVQYTTEQYNALFDQRLQEELGRYDKLQRQLLPSLIEQKLSLAALIPHPLGHQLASVIEESLSEAFRLFQMSSDGTEESVVTEDDYRCEPADKGAVTLPESSGISQEFPVFCPNTGCLNRHEVPRSNGCDQLHDDLLHTFGLTVPPDTEYNNNVLDYNFGHEATEAQDYSFWVE